jgi:hypothetical protein
VAGFVELLAVGKAAGRAKRLPREDGLGRASTRRRYLAPQPVGRGHRDDGKVALTWSTAMRAAVIEIICRSLSDSSTAWRGCRGCSPISISRALASMPKTR